jgi:glycosyltransferase involved in cell wall biosynthesis
MRSVLFVFNHPAFYKVRLLNSLCQDFDLSVIFERDKNKDRNKQFYFEEKYFFKNIRIKGLKLGKENIVSNGIVKTLKNNKYDLVVMNGYSTFAEMKAIRYLKKHNIKYCFYINGGIIKPHELALKRAIKKSFIKGADFYMSPDANSNKYLEYYGADKNKIITYPYSTVFENEILANPLTKDEISQRRIKLGLEAKYIYVSCGQLIHRKNYLSLIRSWPKDKDKLLLIIGEGKEKQRIVDYLCKNKVKNIKLLGYLSREEEFKYYQLADAFVFPSKEDIYGHVINEAMSQGLPVISTTNVNSSKKLIIEGVNGLLIKDLKEIPESLEKVVYFDKEKSLEIARDNTIEKMHDIHIKAFSK